MRHFNTTATIVLFAISASLTACTGAPQPLSNEVRADVSQVFAAISLDGAPLPQANEIDLSAAELAGERDPQSVLLAGVLGGTHFTNRTLVQIEDGHLALVQTRREGSDAVVFVTLMSSGMQIRDAFAVVAQDHGGQDESSEVYRVDQDGELVIEPLGQGLPFDVDPSPEH